MNMTAEPNLTIEKPLETFAGWMTECQAIDPSTLTPADADMWKLLYADARERAINGPKVGLMKLGPMTRGELRYGVAIQEEGKLWLTLWIRRLPSTDIYVLTPRADRGWNPHTSFHRDGKRHMKSYDQQVFPPQQFQPPDANSRGTVPLGIYGGHGTTSVGAMCDPHLFSGIVEVAPGILGGRRGVVSVDLVEPDVEPIEFYGEIVERRVFSDFVPWVVVTIGR